MKRLPKVFAAVVLIGLACGLLPVPLSAAGRSEAVTQSRLDEARRLIAEKQYVQAIGLLSKIARQDREAFDEAQKLLAFIHGVRTEYNRKFRQLMDKLRTDDLAGSLQLISELEELDPNPNETTRQALEQARRGTELVYYRLQFNELMDAALARWRAGQYTEAMETYLGGYSLQRETFERAVASNIARDTVRRNVEAIQGAGRDFLNDAAAAGRELAELESRLRPGASATAEESARRQIEQLSRSRLRAETVRQATLELERQARALAANEDYTDDLYLFFAVRLGFGRTWQSTAAGEPLPDIEGVLFLLQDRWADRIDRTVDALRQAADEAYGRGLNLFESGQAEAVMTELERARELYRLAAEMLGLWGADVDPAAGLALSAAGARQLGDRLGPFLDTQIKLAACDGYPQLIHSRRYLAEASSSTQASVDSYHSTRAELRRQLESLRRLQADWQERQQRLAGLPPAIGGADQGASGADQGAGGREGPSAARAKSRVFEGLDQTIRRVAADVERVLTELEGEDIRLAVKLADLQLQAMSAGFTALQERFDQGRSLTEGLAQTKELRDGSGALIETLTRLERYPTRALEILQPLPSELAGLAGRIDAFLRSWDSPDPYFRGDGETQDRKRRLVELRSRTDPLMEEVLRASSLAAERLALAGKFRQEGELRIREARENLRRLQPALAKESLAAAGRSLDLSLENQEDAEVRRLRDVELLAISASIVQAEHESVVREVLELIRQGQAQYKAGRYSEAERVLLRAQSRWADTNTGENPEISTWLALSRNALAARSGWEVPQADPLYQNYSQLFGLAVEDYQRAQRLLEARQTREAMERLKGAEEKIRLVLYMFPRNLPARLLGLRVSRLQDPESFPRKIDSLYREALETMRRGDRQEAYTLLKSLEEIQPSYPGLREAIIRIEEELGIRRRPIPQAALREAEQLTRQARATVDRGRRSELEGALAQINRALELNPDSEPALALKYRILAALGGHKELILPAEVDRQLRLAEEKLLAGSLFESLAVITELEKNYPRIEAVKEAKRRIESRLYGGSH